jgi:hypothetical protein
MRARQRRIFEEAPHLRSTDRSKPKEIGMRRVVAPGVSALFLTALTATSLSAQVKPKQDTIRPVQPTLRLIQLAEFEVTDLVCEMESAPGPYSAGVRRVEFNLRNKGSAFSGNLEFRVVGIESLSGGATMEQRFTLRGLSLASGADTVIRVPRHTSFGRFDWPTPWNDHPTMNFFVYTDPSNEIAERDEQNNTFSKAVSFPMIEVTHPGGGAIWRKGTAQTVRWRSERLSGHVRIEAHRLSLPYLTRPLRQKTISDNAPNTGQYRVKLGFTERGDSIYLGAGYWRIYVESMDHPFVSDTSDGHATVVWVTARDEGWYTDWRWNPQNLWLKITKAGRIKPRTEFTQLIQRRQVNFELPEAGADMDLDFQIPIEYLGRDAQKRLSITVQIYNDQIYPGIATWNQFRHLLERRSRVSLRQGFTKQDLRFQLSWAAFSVLDGMNKPLTVKLRVRDDQDYEQDFETYIRVLQQ